MERDDSFYYAVRHPPEPSNAMPSIGSDDEDSFVVLSTNDDVSDGSLHEVLPPIRSGKIQDMQNLIKMEISQINSSNPIPELPVVDTLNGVTTSVANITLSPDASYEEIQKHVEELIKENEKLKNIVAQNNISMKTQYDRILAWKEEVNEVMKSYKNKFLEAKTYMDKCKEENSKLANDVEKYKNIKELQDEEIINLKRKEKERENKGYVANSAEQNIIQFDLQIAKEKIEDLQTELAEANLEKVNLASENEKLVEKLVVTPKLEEELQFKEKEINDLKMQLETQNNQEKSLSDTIIKLKNENAELKLTLEKELEKIQKLTESNSTISSYENKLQSNEKKILQLELENAELRRNKTSLTEQIITARTQFQNYDPNLEEKCDQLNQQLVNSQMTITALQQANRNNVKEIEELRQLLQSSSKTDEIYALKEQLAVYKHDFEAERESKNAIKRGKDQLAEDLQNLQKRNKQLQQEVELLRKPSKAEGYMCPKCSFAFNSYQSLENHVHRCLDLEGFP
ncbi:Nemo domain containing protein [Asbolus verrucosus]|uniref:Nemo domain containing protein n=1 Tax=Asbolus verrucosus TaxID=1661398 RepID=A0A482VED6_ASBVE|nr:Nemo domain containing protein [Asbolus verrucosus]